MKAIVRKEVHLPEPKIKALAKEATKNGLTIKKFMETVLIERADLFIESNKPTIK